MPRTGAKRKVEEVWNTDEPPIELWRVAWPDLGTVAEENVKRFLRDYKQILTPEKGYLHDGN